jgi:hypothetical protein
MTRNQTTSKIVTALEKAWAEIREQHPEVPDAVMIVASGTMMSTKRLGHYAEGRWSRRDAQGAPRIAEVLVSGEGLQRPAGEVMDTLLHEAAHGLARARELKDTSRGGRYHNKVFKGLAEEMGLKVEKLGSFGLASTSLQPETIVKWAKTINDLGAAIQYFRFAEGQGEEEEKKKSRLLKAVCFCNRKIRLSQEVFDEGPITCGVCGNAFELEE